MARHLVKRMAKSTAIVLVSLSLANPSQALVAPVILGAPVIYGAGSTYVLSAMTGFVGLVGLYMGIKDATDNEVRIPLGPGIDKEPPAPAAAPTVGMTDAYTVNGTTYSSASAACNANIAYQNSLQVTSNFGMGDGKSQYAREGTTGCTARTTWTRYSDGYTSVGGTSELGVFPTSSCGAGYVSSGGSCTLVNARQATDDNKCDLLVSNGAFAAANDQNCGAALEDSKLSPLLRDGKVIAYGQNSSGQPLIFTVAPVTTSGSWDWTEVKIQEQVQTSTQTQIKTTTATVNAQTGQITNVATDTQVGSIASPSAGSVPTAQPTVTSPTNTPTVTTNPTSQVQPKVDLETCGLPGKPACAVDDSGFQSQPKPWDGVAPPDFNTAKNAIEGLSDPAITWTNWLPSLLPGSPTACHPLEFRGLVATGPAAGLDSTTTYDPCSLFEYIRMFLGFIFGFTTVLYIWRTFMSSQSAGKK